jgi:hypothetical protein
MSIFNFLGIVNTVGIAFIIIFNWKVRRNQKQKGIWRND